MPLFKKNKFVGPFSILPFLYIKKKIRYTKMNRDGYTKLNSDGTPKSTRPHGAFSVGPAAYEMATHPNFRMNRNDRRPSNNNGVKDSTMWWMKPGTGFSVFQVRHPKNVNFLSSLVGGFFASLVFTVLVGVGTGFLHKTCTLDGGGNFLMGYCDIVPGSSRYEGSHPDFATNLGLLALVVFGARFFAQCVSGQWSAGDIDLPFTILRTLKTWIVGDEDRQLFNRIGSIFGQLFGAVTAAFIVWAILGTNASYSRGGRGLGGPGVSTYGLNATSRVWMLIIVVSFVRGLAYLWTSIERLWTTNADKMSWEADYYLVGMTHHVRAFTLALIDAGLVAVSGIVIGTSGFWWRDATALIFNSVTCAESEESSSFCNRATEPTSGGYALFLGVPLIGYTMSLAVCLVMLAVIKLSNRDKSM